jgi:hypothetical protein
MSKTITNLTLTLVAEEIETVLDAYHYHPYRQAFAIPELRQELIAYVLSSVPACYALVDETEMPRADAGMMPGAIRSQLQSAIADGVERLVEEHSDWVSHHIPQEINAAYTPSDWFG